MNLEFPPKKDTPRFDDWMYQLWKLVSTPTSGIVETNHALLGNLNSTVYTHLTATQAQSLTTGFSSPLHYHTADRDRANHTGVQTASTISDLDQTMTNAFRLKGYTVATLPAGVQGDEAFVTDGLAPAYLVAIAGGGAVVTPVFFNGAAWVAH